MLILIINFSSDSAGLRMKIAIPRNQRMKECTSKANSQSCNNKNEKNLKTTKSSLNPVNKIKSKNLSSSDSSCCSSDCSGSDSDTTSSIKNTITKPTCAKRKVVIIQIIIYVFVKL